ncbi:helix-turn-helix domain-containing protein [Aeromicrobium sp. CFBP 8757]|uniref:PucR family transcriptional regulator n=1 Tax=Aeromicrobium sp. CFBP 8757 TaxID=2775288 RepID=UPI001782CCF7|nr:helix-turn-helix domain-containing protein [Aeromicrobium sp. CFBP 8757]
MGQTERGRIQQRVVASRTVVTERISGAIRQQIPAYATLGDAQRRETEAIAAWGVQRLLELWVSGTSLDEADLRQFHGIGVARGTDGRPLFAVLRAYRVAAVEASDLIHQMAGDDLTLDDALALNRVLLESLDEISEVLFAGHTAATTRLTGDRADVVRALADDLVTGRQTSTAALADRSEQLGIALPSRFGLTVVGSPDGEEVTAGEVARFAAAVDDPDGDALVLTTTRSGQGVLLHSRPVVDATPSARWRVCVVDDVALADLPATFRVASAAVRHAPAEAFGSGPLDEADALLVALLRGEPRVDPRTFASTALRPLLAPGQAHVLEGLSAYLLTGSSTEAGRRLGLHPQSMRHRLRRSRAVTGRDLADPWDHLVLRTATTVLAIAAD